MNKSELLQTRNRWLILLGAWGVYATFGMLITLNGALVPLIREDLSLSRAQMGLILGAWQFVYIATAIPAGRLIDWLGVRRAITLSLVVMLSSALLRTAATGFWSLLIPVALFGVGAPIISIGAPTIAASLFEDADRRRAVGLYGTAPGIGGFLALTLSTNVIGPLVNNRWQSITIVMIGIGLVSFVTWLLVSKGLDDEIAPGGGPNLNEYLAIAKKPVVTFVLVLAVLNFFAAHAIGQWLVGLLNDAGWSTKDASLWAAGATLVGLVATFVVPRFANAERRKYLLIAVFVVGAAGSVLLMSKNVAVLGVALGASSIPRSVVMPILVMIMMDHRDVGPTKIAAASGLFFSISQIGGVAGPATIGAIADASGGFQLSLFLVAGVMLATAGLLMMRYDRAVE